MLLLNAGLACATEGRNVVVEEPPPPQQQNMAPVIRSVTQPDKVLISSKIPITCVAEDDEGDNITYTWNCDNGTIEGQGKDIFWIAPGIAGIYNIKLMVADMVGNTVSDSVAIKVTDIPNRAPVIDRFIIMSPKPTGKIEMRPYEELYIQPKISVRIYTPLPIQIIAEDPDGDVLSYEWTCTEGIITDKENNKAVWIAPTNPIRQYIAVMVMDKHGGSATAKLAVEVSCCK
jgi:hypothetical protein